MSRPSDLQRRLHRLLDGYRGVGSRTINALLMLLIFLNVTAVVAESVGWIYELHARRFVAFEVVSVAIFSVEYLLRLFAAPANPAFAGSRRPRLAFVRSGMAIIDLLAIAPFYLGMFVSVDARALRGLRLVRVFKLTRYSASMDLMATVIKKELPSIGSALFIMCIMIMLAASGIYVVERDVQPEHFGSIPAALWWATVTLSTVGYGDVIPHTVLGRIFGMTLMIMGVGMAALPAGILASGYSRELTLRRERYETELKAALEGGAPDRERLARLRDELGLSVDETEAQRAALAATSCPHCGKEIGGTG